MIEQVTFPLRDLRTYLKLLIQSLTFKRNSKPIKLHTLPHRHDEKINGQKIILPLKAPYESDTPIHRRKSIPSMSGSIYIVSILDDYTAKADVFMLKKNDEPLSFFR